MRNSSDMDLFINGVNVGGFFDGSSSLPMSSNSPGDVSKIGYWSSNGNSYLFKGYIDELRVWNRSLPESEIRTTMCKRLTGNEIDLIGYWTFDETSGNTVIDKSSNHFDGTLIGNPNRVFSGAPIGDESVFLYPSNWSATSISLIDGPTSIEASGFTNNPPGAHIYKVASIPSQTGGLTSNEIKSPYYGIFTALVSGSSNFNVSHKVNNLSSCNIKGRTDNSVSNWIDKTGTGIQDRLEFIGISSGSDLSFSLGDDAIICDQSDLELSTGLDPEGKSFQWSTGETTSTITVSTPGNYSVTVSEGCNSENDEVLIIYSSPPPIDQFLGDNALLCDFSAIELKPFANPTDYYFTWQDDSHNDSFQVTSFGKYWVKIQNYSGVAYDTIEVRQLVILADSIPNVITPNDDEWNQMFIVQTELQNSYLSVFSRWGKLVYENADYQNNWDGENLDSGIYFYLIRDKCQNQIRGTLSIIR